MVCCCSSDIWLDEAYSLREIQYSYSDMLSIIRMDVHPPLYFIMLKAVEDFFGLFIHGFVATVVVGKLLSAVAYILTAVLLWYKLRDCGKDGVWELSAISLFASYWLLRYGFQIRMYSWAVFFVTGVLLFARDIMISREGGSKYRSWIGMLLFTLAAAYMHYWALMASAVIWLCLLVFLIWQNHKELIKWLIFGLLTVLGYLPWLPRLFSQMSNVASLGFWIEPLQLSSVIDFVVFWFPSILILLPILVCIRLGRRQFALVRNASAYPDWMGFLVSVITPILIILYSLLITPSLQSRYLLPACFCAWVAIWLISRHMPARLRSCMAAALVFSLCASCVVTLSEECSAALQAKQAVALASQIEENESIVFVGSAKKSDVAYVISAQTDAMVYYAESFHDTDDFMLTIAGTVFANTKQLEENSHPVEQALSDGMVLYYLVEDELDITDADPAYTIESLGSYRFETDEYVYRIQKN